MAKRKIETVYKRILIEKNQTHETRLDLYKKMEADLGAPVLAFFTSFRYSVYIQDSDAELIEGILKNMDLKKGLYLIIDSLGGFGMSAERIINICRSYSKTDEYCVVVPAKAKSAATMICLGASRILMSPSAELGPIDPQITITEGDEEKHFSVTNIIESYEDLFARAVKEKGNLEPYIQQLSHYDEREIVEFKSRLELSEDIAIKSLRSGMMNQCSDSEIKQKIKVFLKPEKTKAHGRPIYRDEARACNLSIEDIDISSKLWDHLYELYVRLHHCVATDVSKCIESAEHSFVIPKPK